MERLTRPPGELFAWPIAGYVIASLLLELGRQRTIEDSVLRTFCDTLDTFGSLWWFGPLWASLYGPYRSNRFPHDASIVLFVGLVGSGIGFLRSAYVMASPGPNHWTNRWEVPLWCLFGCLVGAAIVAYLEDSRTSRPRSENDR